MKLASVVDPERRKKIEFKLEGLKGVLKCRGLYLCSGGKVTSLRYIFGTKYFMFCKVSPNIYQLQLLSMALVVL